jgi:glutaredoxin
MKIVTLYTKRGCHLCETVEAVLAEVARRRQFTLARRDISEDAADYEQFKHEIPVVLVDGVEIARHRMTAQQLIAALTE